MTPPESQSVALELERLRGAVDTGFATLNGRLDVALTRTSQTEADIDGLEQRADGHEDRLTVVERKMWIAVGAALPLGGAAGAAAQALLR